MVKRIQNHLLEEFPGYLDPGMTDASLEKAMGKLAAAALEVAEKNGLWPPSYISRTEDGLNVRVVGWEPEE